jgi:DNA-binding NtrC family response regulator
LTLPPLRRRREDIPLLVNHFVELARSSGMSAFAGLGPAALTAMTSYDWPGNIRQLRAEVMCIAAVTPADKVVQEWRPRIRWTEDYRRPITEVSQTSFDPDDAEQLRVLLAHSQGQVSAMARALGLSRSHLYRLLSRHGISTGKAAE